MCVCIYIYISLYIHTYIPFLMFIGSIGEFLLWFRSIQISSRQINYLIRVEVVWSRKCCIKQFCFSRCNVSSSLQVPLMSFVWDLSGYDFSSFSKGDQQESDKCLSRKTELFLWFCEDNSFSWSNSFLILAAWLSQAWIYEKAHYTAICQSCSHLWHLQVPYHVRNQSQDVDLPATWRWSHVICRASHESHASRVEESNVMRSNCDSSCVIKHRVKHQDNSKSTPFFFVEINAFVNFDKVCFVCFFVSGRAGGSRALAKRRWCCRWTSPPLWRSKLPEAKQNEAWRNSVAKIRRLAGLTLWSLDKAC